MEEIKIIEDVEPERGPEDRTQYYEDLADAHKDIPRYHFASFAQLAAEAIHDENRFIKPTLKELLLRKIVQLSIGYRSEYNVTIVPILPSLSTISIKRQGMEILKSAPRGTRIGGAAPPFRRPQLRAQPKRAADVSDAIKVRFDTPVFTVTTNGMDYIVPPNEEINVIGVIVNPLCAPPSTLVGDRVRPITAVQLRELPVPERLLIGQFSTVDALRACPRGDVAAFTRPSSDIVVGTEHHDAVFKIMFRDAGDDLAAMLGDIFDYIVENELYARSAAGAINVASQLSFAARPNAPRSAMAKAGVITPWLAALFDRLYALRPIVVTAEPEPPKDDFLVSLEKLNYQTFSLVYRLSLLVDLDGLGLLRVWNLASIKGRDAPDVRRVIEQYNLRKKRLEFQRDLRKKALEESNKLEQYKLIISRKIGAQRLAEIEHGLATQPALTAKADGILTLLKPQERKVVELEYDRRQKYIDAVLNNKCKHVQLYRRLRQATAGDVTRQLFSELKTFMAPTSGSGMIKCKVCEFDLICPHLVEYIELDLRGAMFGEFKAKLARFIEKVPIDDQYFCRICGEVISSAELLGDVGPPREHSSAISDELKGLIWGEIATLVRHMKFGTMVNVPQLINLVRDTIYPFIFEIEKQILKSKTNTADEIKAKKRLYISIYAMAYMINLIVQSQSMRNAEVTFRGFKPRDPKKLVVELIKHGIDLLTMSKNIVIREIPGMTNDIIKNKLIEAYKIMSMHGVQTVQRSAEGEDLLVAILLDPIYRYIYRANLIDDMLNGRAPPSGPKARFDPMYKIEPLLGAPIARLAQQDDVYRNAKMPKLDQRWRLKEFDGLTAPPDEWPGLVSRGYLGRSFELFMDKMRKQIHMEYMYVDASADKKSQDSFMDVRLREPHAIMLERYLDLAKKEAYIEWARGYHFARSYLVKSDKANQRWSGPQVPLGRIYDEDGNFHSWVTFRDAGGSTRSLGTTMYILDGPAPRREVSARDVAKAIEAGQPFTEAIVDRRCSVCGTLASKADALDESKIIESIDARHIVNNFFRFYENRCPAGGLHEMSADKCKKCKFEVSMLVEQTSKSALGYYREHKDTYVRERDEFISQLGRDARVSSSPKPPHIDDWSAEYDNWSFNFNIVLDLANRLKINQRLFTCLGAVEKQEYTEVQSGAYIPSEPNDRHDTRIYVVNAYIKTLLMEYNMIRFFHRVLKPPQELSALIDNSGINKHRIAELETKLPDVYNDYNSRFRYFQLHKKPREIINFCIQSFCEMCLRIYTDKDADTERLRHGFVEYIVKKVLRSDELVSKPGHFNWSLLYGDKEQSEKESYDSNFSPEADGEHDQYDDEADEELDDFGDSGKPMRDNFDTDLDDEDNDNDINVGEDLGLS